MLPQLRELESTFGDAIAVVGVHSGKFAAERVTANIRDASIRLDAIHPTINDRQFRIWRSYAVKAWPTLVAIDPRGYVVGMRAGEFAARELHPFIRGVLDASRDRGDAAAIPLEHSADAPTHSPSRLAYPGKVAVEGRRIAIADSGNRRVLIGTLDSGGARAHIDRAIGGDAGFQNPQGICFGVDSLYVADAGSHTVRSISLATGETRTLAGTGAQRRTEADAEAGALSSPWDVALRGDTLFIAMAGTHQLWTHRLGAPGAHVLSGSGAEELHDASHADAALAQPMGLCLDDAGVVFADSESSAIRHATFFPGGEVTTYVGTGLFDFGDVDGAGDAVRLQHPQAVARAPDGRILIADSYNGSLKWLDPSTRRVETWLSGLAEPSGIAIAGNRVYIAETNAHRIAVADLASGAISVLQIEP